MTAPTGLRRMVMCDSRIGFHHASWRNQAGLLGELPSHMCGIFAAMSRTKGGLPGDVALRIDRALNAIAHRGPDGSGRWVDPGMTMALGHVRLAVLDVRAEANQPFWSECGRYAIVFNGEIYNFVELRRELEAEGHRFRTTSDTEVLLQALISRGTDVINRFNGMWAFVLVDTLTGEAIVCRDRFGVKPLYTMQHGDVLLLASEAKAIIAYLGEMPRPNRRSIGLYLKHGVAGEHDESWFEGIRRFEPAHWQRVRTGFAPLPPRRFWDYPQSRIPLKDAEALEALREMLGSAVRIRTRSDVPLGLSLSGGLDSSSIAWLLREECDLTVDAYCAWFEPVERSELGRATSVCHAFRHRLQPVREVKTEQVRQDLQTSIRHLDSPHASTALVPYLTLCRAARKKLTVILEGQGADELLMGYPFLYAFAAIDYAVRGRLVAAWQTFAGESRASNLRTAAATPFRYAIRPYAERQHRQWMLPLLADPEIRSPAGDGGDGLRWRATVDNAPRALEIEHRRRLRSLLQYGDALSMAFGLESRCPFMDYRMVEFGFSLTLDKLMRHGFGKWLLRSLADPVLPREVVWPLRKDGFTNATVSALRRHVRTHGASDAGARAAVELGFLSRESLRPEVLLSMPDAAFYRILSTQIWAGQHFASRQAGNAR
jgi:asparagine synthase (glutamine-hydrolysing)